MSGLPWVRLDTTFPDNPKVLDLLDGGDEPPADGPATSSGDGRSSGFVYVCSLAYAGAHGTDGFIPRAALRRIHGTRAEAARLVDVGLWEAVEGGWIIPNWRQYQQAAESTARTRAAQRSGGSKGNCVRWHGPDCGCWRGDDLPADGSTAPVQMQLVRRSGQ